MATSERIVETGDDLFPADPAEDIHAIDLVDGRRAFVRVISLTELEAFQAAYLAAGKTDVRARLIVAACCDSRGGLHYKLDDLDRVKTMHGSMAVVISNKIMEINRLTEDEIKPVKNDSGTTIANGSSSD